jgi:hypothetical protein
VVKIKQEHNNNNNNNNKTHFKNCRTYVISGFCHNVDEICALMGYYAAYSGNYLPTWRTITEERISQLRSK